MTARELAVFIGCIGDLHPITRPLYRHKDLVFRVRVLDARRAWNRVDYLVTPVAGSGEQWVAADRVDGLEVPS